MEKLFRGIVSSDRYTSRQKKALVDQVIKGALETPQDVPSLLRLAFEWTLSPTRKPTADYAANGLIESLGAVYPTHLATLFSPNAIHHLLREPSPPSSFSRRLRLVRTCFDVLSRRLSTDDLREYCTIVTSFASDDAALNVIQSSTAWAEFARIFKISHDILPTEKDNLKTFSLYIVRAVGTNVVVIDDASGVDDVNLVVELLSTIWNENPEFLDDGLKFIFRIISTLNAEPSPCLASIVRFVPASAIAPAIEAVLSNRDVVDDASITLALQRMIDWLEWPGCRGVDVWLIAFFRELARRRKFSVLIGVTLRRVGELFRMLDGAGPRAEIARVLEYVLLSYQHSPDAFHKVVDDIPDMMRRLRCHVPKEFMNRLSCLWHCLFSLHPGYPDRYEPVLSAIEDYIKPSTDYIRTAIAEKAWTASSSDHLLSCSLYRPRSNTEKAGLVNLGNTCYMNSVVQALFMQDALYQSVITAEVDTQGSCLFELQRLFTFLTLTTRSAYAPISFYKVAKPTWFNRGLQQDCAEFLRNLVDRIRDEESESTTTKAKASKHLASSERQPLVTGTWFDGTLSTGCKCKSCGTVSTREEPFTDISLAMPSSSSSDVPSVSSLLDEFQSIEALTDENRYYCNACESLCDSQRWIGVKRAPRCLLLTLKRFAYDVATRKRTKLLREVDCPLTLDLPIERGSQAVTYDLNAIVVHSGASSDCGHYYTYARHSSASSDDWFLLNDSSVTVSSYQSFCKRSKRFPKDTAYLLLYMRKECDAAVSLSRKALPLPKLLVDAVTRDNEKFLEEQEKEAQRVLQSHSKRVEGHHADKRDPPSSGCGIGGGPNFLQGRYIT